MFDHHCKWLNNCIGAKNYVEFFVLVLCSLVEEAFKFAVNLYVVVVLLGRDPAELGWLFYLNSVFSFLGILPIIALTFLLGLHGYLICTKSATHPPNTPNTALIKYLFRC